MLGLEDWPPERRPGSIEQKQSTPVALNFPINQNTGKLDSTHVEIQVVTSDFEVEGTASKRITIPPYEYSDRVSFRLLANQKTGECQINLEVYSIDNIHMGERIPLATNVVQKAQMSETKFFSWAVRIEVIEPKTPTPQISPTPTSIPPTPTPEPPTPTPEPPTPTPTSMPEPSTWYHVGFGKFGYTYYQAQEYYKKNGWRLPSIDELEIIDNNYFLEVVGVLENVPYWTLDRAKNGKPYGYCFGTVGRCKDIKERAYRDYSENDALAILLVRELSMSQFVIVISGNEASTGDYWITAKNSVAELWDDISSKGAQIFISVEGKIHKITRKETLSKFSTSYTATNFYIDKEIEKAGNYFSEEKNGDNHLIYIAKNPGNISYKPADFSIHVISPDPKPQDWVYEWHTSKDEEELKTTLTKLLGGVDLE